MSRFVLGGLPGDNPLGFMAALGTLLTAERVWPDADAGLSWAQAPAGWRPAIQLDLELAQDALLEGLLGELKKGAPAQGKDAAEAQRLAKAAVRKAKAALKQAKAEALEKAKAKKLKRKERNEAIMRETAALEQAVIAAERQAAVPGSDATAVLGQDLRMGRQQAEPHFRRAAAETSPAGRRTADILAGFGCEAVTDKGGNIGISKLSKQNGNSEKHMLADVLSIRAAATVDSLRRSLFAPWDYADAKWSLGWDPADVRPYAYQAVNPDKGGSHTMHGANLLAYEAFALFPVGVHRNDVLTTGSARIDGAWQMSWPLWTSALPSAVVRSLVAHPALQEPTPDAALLARMGVTAVWRSEHFSFNKSPRFKPAHPV